MSGLINGIIFVITLTLLVRISRKDGAWSLPNLVKAFRYFTVQSNAFCAAASLLMCLFPGARWAWTLKYVGTAAVTVTMLTVLLFLGPSMGSYKPLLTGPDFFMHLLTPLLALLSFLVFERRGMGFAAALWGMLPVALYGVRYLYKAVFAPEDRRWEDFYGFNKGGKWPVAFMAMMLGGFGVCMGLMGLQNL